MSTCKRPAPERTCVACRQTMPKWELVRLVHTSGGTIKVDEKGKAAGRGAYLCRTKRCWELALAGGKKDRLAQALRTKITLENREALSEYSTAFSPSETVAERGIE